MKLLKRLSVLALTAALTLSMAVPAMAAGSIEVTEDVSVSDDYDWTRFKGQNMTLNVYNWGEYISNGSDDSEDVVSDFEKLTGIKVNYTTFDSNESMYAKLKSGAEVTSAPDFCAHGGNTRRTAAPGGGGAGPSRSGRRSGCCFAAGGAGSR